MFMIENSDFTVIGYNAYFARNPVLWTYCWTIKINHVQHTQ